jgi:hypothetical protein
MRRNGTQTHGCSHRGLGKFAGFVELGLARIEADESEGSCEQSESELGSRRSHRHRNRDWCSLRSRHLRTRRNHIRQHTKIPVIGVSSLPNQRLNQNQVRGEEERHQWRQSNCSRTNGWNICARNRSVAQRGTYGGKVRKL